MAKKSTKSNKTHWAKKQITIEPTVALAIALGILIVTALLLFGNNGLASSYGM